MDGISEGLSAISQIKAPKDSQQAALDQLLQQAEATERLDTDAINTLHQISDLLEDILLAYRAQRDQDQWELDTYFSALQACYDNAGFDVLATIEATVNQSQSNHSTCRGYEEILFDDDAVKCASLISFLTTTYNSALDCTLPDATLAAIPTWNTFLSTGDTWFSTTITNYLPVRDACVLSSETLASSIVECNTNQLTYEGHFCQYHTQTLLTCSNADTCKDNRIAGYNNLTATLIPIANLRVNEANLITYVLCLIDNLIDGLTDHTLCPTKAQYDQEWYNNTYNQTIPERHTICVHTANTVYPGSVGWQAYAYSTLSVKTPPLENDGIDCYAAP